MPVSNPSRRTGPRRSALVVAGLAAALTLGAAAGLGGPAAPAAPAAAAVVTLPADPAPPTAHGRDHRVPGDADAAARPRPS